MALNMSKINPIGIISGISILFLPLAGHWWVFGVGDLFILNISPFDVSILIAGDKISSPLFFWLTKVLTVIILISGISMIIGSVSLDKWYGPLLVKFSSLKVLRLVISTGVAMILVLPALGNNLNNYMDIPFDIDIPVQGESTITYKDENLYLKMNIFSEFTNSFFFACFVGLTGAASRLYLMKVKRSGN